MSGDIAYAIVGVVLVVGILGYFILYLATTENGLVRICRELASKWQRQEAPRGARAVDTTRNASDFACVESHASSSTGADMTVSAMADLLRVQLGLSVDIDIVQVANAAAEQLELQLPVDMPLKDKLDAAIKSFQSRGQIDRQI